MVDTELKIAQAMPLKPTTKPNKPTPNQTPNFKPKT